MKAATLQLRNTYLNLREALNADDELMAELSETVENARQDVRTLAITHLEETRLKREENLRQLISLEQRSNFRVPGIQPILGEWGLKTALYPGDDGNIRRATLVSPKVDLVNDTLSHHKPKLVNELRLAGNFDLKAILELKRMEWLHTLNLRHSPMGAAGILSLAHSPHLGRLQKLDLSFTGIGYQGVEDLLNSSNLPKLETLVLQQKMKGKKPKDHVPPPSLEARELEELAISAGRERFKFLLK